MDGNTQDRVEDEFGKEKRSFDDVYDLYTQVIKVHTDIPEITSDFVISDLREENLDNKAVKFVRNQIKVCGIINIYLKDQPQVAGLITKLLMKDVQSTIIMSRAVDGKILRSILSFGQGKEEEEPLSLKDKLLGRREDGNKR